jgi:hypothetical protein
VALAPSRRLFFSCRLFVCFPALPYTSSPPHMDFWGQGAARFLSLSPSPSPSPSPSLSLPPSSAPSFLSRSPSRACMLIYPGIGVAFCPSCRSFLHFPVPPDTSRPRRLHFWRRRAAPGSRPPHRPSEKSASKLVPPFSHVCPALLASYPLRRSLCRRHATCSSVLYTVIS